MKKTITWTICCLFFALTCYAGTVSLEWDAPTTYEDDTDLPLSDIAYYNIYWGTVYGTYPNVVSNITETHVVLQIPGGISTVYAVATAVTISDIESAYSNVASGPPKYIVQPVAGAHTYIAPSSAQTVTSGLSTAFTVTTDSGYTAQAEGCGGTLTGSTFTIAAVSTDCTWTASVVTLFETGQYVQAEAGTISGLATGVSGSDTYVYATTENTGYVRFAFNITSARTYRLEARVNSHNSTGQNSFFVGWDGAAAQGNDTYAYDIIPVSSPFVWDNVTKRGTGAPEVDQFDPMTWSLSVGVHTVTFYGREMNAWLDQIRLVPLTYSVGGQVSGLVGQVVLRNNGGDDKAITANGSYAFLTTLPTGSAYDVTILTQPAGRTCAVANGSGQISGSGANVTNVNVACELNPQAVFYRESTISATKRIRAISTTRRVRGIR